MLKKLPIKPGVFLAVMILTDLLFLAALVWWLWAMVVEINYHKALPKIPASTIPQINKQVLDELSK